MKWFHHECSAKHDPRLQVLGSLHGAAGLGIYWGLLEEIGGHSETFHLKVSGVSEEMDGKFEKLLKDRIELSADGSEGLTEASRIPKVPAKILARILFTTHKTLLAVIETAANEGLFDMDKWAGYNVLYSPSFEHRADDYTRRQRRSSENVRRKSEECSEQVRTLTEQSTDALRTLSDKVLLEQNRIEQKEKRNRTEQTREKSDLPTGYPHEEVEKLEKRVITQEFAHYRQEITAMIRDWNSSHLNRFDWSPSEEELNRVFFEGAEGAKEQLCEQATNLAGEPITYPMLALHAVKLMLRASEKGRITNPDGWIRACLFGRRNGDLPWILAEGSFPPRSPP